MKTTSLIVLSIAFAVSASAAQRTGNAAANATPEQHKEMMDEVGDSQEDLRESIATKDVKAANAAAVKVQAFMEETQIYWAARKFADVNKLADQSVAQSKDIVKAVSAGKLDEARGALDKLSATCNACHELHPEQRK
ncbi:MAG TPA: hypothetical protein VJP86_12415 [Vicinamibacterales bacterium]|jgi:cytochrome c556|nr:hypothetical protein [Vicinamibacterales bacterium]